MQATETYFRFYDFMKREGILWFFAFSFLFLVLLTNKGGSCIRCRVFSFPMFKILQSEQQHREKHPQWQVNYADMLKWGVLKKEPI